MNIRKFKFSTFAILIVVSTALTIDLNLKKWEKTDGVIAWDIHSYYAYLPLTFIYEDIHIVKDTYVQEDNIYWFWPSKTKDGKNVIKTTCGLSLLYTPFFLIAHVLAPLFNYSPDGFSVPYKIFLLISSLFYLLVGLYYVKRILIKFQFSDKIISYTIIALGIGTNLLAYSSSLAPMPHVYNFSLMAAFIYYTVKWHENQKIKNIVVLGLVLGLITLIRPTNIIIVLFFLFYGISDLVSLKEKITLFRSNFLKLNLFVLLSFLVWLPQFYYWNLVTGNFIYNSYGSERFFFNDPQIYKGLFGFQKGWLIYTPIMGFALLGVFFLRNKLKNIQIPIALFISINIYIIFSWWCWWYGGSYGQRSMIDSYSLLAIPLAAFISRLDKIKILKYLFYGVIVFFIWLNIFQTYQYEHKSLHHDSMSFKLYLKQFGKLKPIDNFWDYLDWMNYEEARDSGRGKDTE